MFYRSLIVVIALFYSAIAVAQSQNCITLAAQCYKVNPLLIKAIIWHESKNNQKAISKNKNNTVDVGVMQINSVNFKKFETFGVSEHDLRNNSCANVFAGTWMLNQSTERYGYSWDSIGRYHSSTPHHQISYANKIINIIAYKHKEISNIQIPLSTVTNKFKCLDKS